MKELDSHEQIDLLYQEFMFEHNRADIYIERNYQVLGLWAAALAGLFAIGMNEDFVKTDIASFLIFAEMIPVLNFVFAIIYLFNSYANIRCGTRAEAIHKAVFSKSVMFSYNQIKMPDNDTKDFFISNLPVYILTESIASAPMYTALVLVIIASSVFGYYYALSTCVGEGYKYATYISAGILLVLTISVSILYIVLLIKNGIIRGKIKKS